MSVGASYATEFSRAARYSAAALALVTLGMFWDVLFTGRPIVLSNAGSEIATYFVPMREFGFGEIRKGHIPFWNPYVFCGAPYAANYRSAIFYPLNWLHLMLPAAVALNWIIAIHFFLAAWFTSMCRRRAGWGWRDRF